VSSSSVYNSFLGKIKIMLIYFDFMLSHLVTFINPLKTNRRPLYLKTQSIPRCKHFISVIKTNQFML